MGQIADAPFTPWLENVVKELFDIQPTAIAMQMRDDGGKCYTCYWDVSADDRAVMIDAMKEYLPENVTYTVPGGKLYEESGRRL